MELNLFTTIRSKSKTSRGMKLHARASALISFSEGSLKAQLMF